MSAKDEIRSTVVFAGTPWEAALIKSLLKNAEIQAFLKDDIYGTLAPWVVAPGGAGAVKVMVSSVDVKLAKQVVDDYEKNKKTQ